jgi:hypothetical protein
MRCATVSLARCRRLCPREPAPVPQGGGGRFRPVLAARRPGPVSRSATSGEDDDGLVGIDPAVALDRGSRPITSTTCRRLRLCPVSGLIPLKVDRPHSRHRVLATSWQEWGCQDEPAGPQAPVQPKVRPPEQAEQHQCKSPRSGPGAGGRSGFGASTCAGPAPTIRPYVSQSAGQRLGHLLGFSHHRAAPRDRWPGPDGGRELPGVSPVSRCAPAAALPMHEAGKRAWFLGPASGDKRVLDRCPDACFHDRMLHQPHARFATPATTKDGVVALVLSPKPSGARAPNRATRATIALPESDRPDGREPAMPLPRFRQSRRLRGRDCWRPPNCVLPITGGC